MPCMWRSSGIFATLRQLSLKRSPMAARRILLGYSGSRPYFVASKVVPKGITMSLMWIIVTYVFVAAVLGTVGFGALRVFGFAR